MNGLLVVVYYYIAVTLTFIVNYLLNKLFRYLCVKHNRKLYEKLSKDEFAFKCLVDKLVIFDEKGYVFLIYIGLIPFLGIVINICVLLVNIILILSESYKSLSKNESDSTIEKDTANLIKYSKIDLAFIGSIIKNEHYPYRQLISDNFYKLIEIIDKKEFELKKTLNENRKVTINKEIKDIAGKFEELVSSINDNLTKNEINKLNELYRELIKIINGLKNKSLTINEFSNKYRDINKTDNDFNLKSKIKIFSKYFNKDSKRLNTLYDLLESNNLPYIESIINLSDSIIDVVKELECKLDFIPSNLRKTIKEKIENTIEQYILLVITLDEVYVPAKDESISDYSELLDSIISDVKNKKAIFK